MSSNLCRCYGGKACPMASAGAEEFFLEIEQSGLPGAVTDAVSDYVRLRGLRGVCPDVTKWGSAPGPSAFLDAGLPKLGGPASVPYSLLADSISYQPQLSEGAHIVRDWAPRTGYKRRSESSVTPSPTWETEGPEGSVSQVLSFDKMEPVAATLGATAAWGSGLWRVDDDPGESNDRFPCAKGSRPTDDLENVSPAKGTAIGINRRKSSLVDAKQLLRNLRQASSPSRGHVKGDTKGGSQSCFRGTIFATSSSNTLRLRPAFSPPDAWDDTGLFTIAPRPKTVPSRTARKRYQHTLAAPVIFRPTSSPIVTSSKVSQLPSATQDAEGFMVQRKDGLDLWSRRRRKVGGGAGDVAVEFLDVREAALVSVAEALARRALPWQSQLCPRAIQDLEIARVRVFHAVEKERREICQARREPFLRGLLLGVERSWELFAREQGGIFADKMEKVNDRVRGCEDSLVKDLHDRTKYNAAIHQQREGLALGHINYFEEEESERAWRFATSTLADTLWDPSITTESIQEEKRRATKAHENFVNSQNKITAQSRASTSLREFGMRALATEELNRWDRIVEEAAADEEARAAEVRIMQRESIVKSYLGVMHTVRDADRMEKEMRDEAWNLEGWLSVGSHKLVQQTLRVLVRGCEHPYAVRQVLWEARQAAEFASAARAAAMSQRAADWKSISNARRDRKATVRAHKNALRKAEEKRVEAEEAERWRTVKQLTLTAKEAAIRRRTEQDMLADNERATDSKAHQDVMDRCAQFRNDMAALKGNMYEQTKTLSASLRERRDRQGVQLEEEVAAAKKALEEEQARANDREALLEEMLLRERDAEDRLLKEWTTRQEQTANTAVALEMEETRTRCSVLRERWVSDVTTSASGVAALDSSFFSSLLFPSSGGRCPPSALDDPPNGRGTPRISFERHEQVVASLWTNVQGRVNVTMLEEEATREAQRMEPGNDTFEQFRAAASLESRAALKRSDRLECLAWLGRRGMSAIWEEFRREAVERVRIAAIAGDTAAERWLEDQRQVVEDFLNACHTDNEGKTVVQIRGGAESLTTSVENDRGQGNRSRENAGAEVGKKGAHVSAEMTYADTNIKTAALPSGAESSSGTELDRADVKRCAHEVTQMSQEIFDEARNSASDDPLDGRAGNPDYVNESVELTHGTSLDNADEAARGEGALAGDRSCCTVDIRKTSNAETVELQFSSSAAEADANRDVPAIVEGVRDFETHEPVDLQEAAVMSVGDTENEYPTLALRADTVTDADKTELSSSSPDSLTMQIVQFVGGATAFHLSTFPSSKTERLYEEDHRKLASPMSPEFSMSSAVGERIYSGLDDIREIEWLTTLAEVVRDREVLDLSKLGEAFGALPGGATILCLAHDSLIESDQHSEGSVRTDILLASSRALVKLRQSVRAAGTRLDGTSECFGRDGVSDLKLLALDYVAKMEADMEMEILGDAVCADLAETFVICSAMAQETGDQVSQTSRVLNILRKHDAILSPQSMCALTALLSAQGPSSQFERCHRHEVDDDDSFGSERVSRSDPVAWKLVLSQALVATRTASLEHAVIWASSCDPDQTAFACGVHAVARKGSTAPTTSDDQEVEHDTEAMKVVLHKASGLGLSALMLSAISLSQGSTRLPGGTACVRGVSQVTDERGGDRGDNDAPGNSYAAVIASSSPVRAALRLLSPRALNSTCDRLSCIANESLFPPTSGDMRSGEERSPNKDDGAFPPVNTSDAPRLLDIVHPSVCDAEMLRKDAANVCSTLDAGGTGVLPPSALVMVLQGLPTTPKLQCAQSEIILRLAGCLPTNDLRAPSKIHVSGVNDTVNAVSYKELMEKLPALVRLVQAARRVNDASLSVTSVSNSERMDTIALKASRRARRHLELYRSATAFAAALNEVCQRMAYTRTESRSSLLEVSRLEAMRSSSTSADESASVGGKARAIEMRHREEVRAAFVSAINDWLHASDASGALMTAMAEARVAATTELWHTGGKAIMKVRRRMAETLEELSNMMVKAEGKLIEEQRSRRIDHDKARQLHDEEPEWWGGGIRREIEDAYRHESLSAQDVVEGLQKGHDALVDEMLAAFREDASSCKAALTKTEEKLDTLVADFEKRRTSYRRAIVAAGRGRRPSDPAQASFADNVRVRHHAIDLCREILSWLGRSTTELEEECAELCARPTALASRVEKRLTVMIKSANAKAAEGKSMIAKRLQAVSNSWRETLLQRRHRWDETRASRKVAREQRITAHRDDGEQTRPTMFPSLVAAECAAILARQFADVTEELSSRCSAQGQAAQAAIAQVTATAISLSHARKAVRHRVVEAGGRIGETTTEYDVAELLKLEHEDTEMRVSECRKAIESWWEIQRTAAAENLQAWARKEENLESRREIHHFLSESLITEVEARHETEVFAKQILAFVLAETTRVAGQFLAGARSATKRAIDRAEEERGAMVRQGDVLLLEAQALSARSSATLLRGLDAAAEDLARAQRKESVVHDEDIASVAEGYADHTPGSEECSATDERVADD